MSQKYKRFRDFENGLKAAYDNYKKWQDDPGLHSLNKAHKNRPPSVELFTRPFAQQGVTAAANIWYRTSALQPGWTSYEGKVGAYTKNGLPNTEVKLPRSNAYKPARVIIKTGIQGIPTEKISHITKRKYKSYGGESVSIPFGAKDATTSMAEAFSAIQTAIGETATTRITMSPEAYRAA